jgi:site-specific DNA-adenine methylase
MKYPGGKGGIYHRLINLMPPHEVYIETHLGGGAIMRNKRSAVGNIGIEIDPEIIEIWNSDGKIGFELVQGDAVTFLKNYKFTGKELVYCDPPYLRETRKKYYPLYKYEYTYNQHVELLNVIRYLPCMVMISGYQSKLYTEVLKDWHTHFFPAATHHGMATEWVWMNYSVPKELHDYRYLGNSFRERERIKRKLKTWVTKFKSTPVLERQAILSAIHDVCKEY